MADSVFVVFGSSGEYSDWRMWAVRAFDTAQEAEAEAKRLNDWVTAHGGEQWGWREDDGYPPGDPEGYHSEQTTYEVAEVPLGTNEAWENA